MIRACSYGGGVQSNALLVLSATITAGRRDGMAEATIAEMLRIRIGRPVEADDAELFRLLDFPLYLFSNVGDDSEHPATLAYIRDHGRPYADAHGIEFVELRRRFMRGERAGKSESLLERIARDTRSIPIPMKMSRTMVAGRRTCTRDFKVEVIDREFRRRGAKRTERAVMALGISLDEWQRMSSDDPNLLSTKIYPLVELRLSRQDCLNIIERAGLPQPPKSSCWFCPMHTLSVWRELRDQEPELFERAIILERDLSERGAGLSTGPVFMANWPRPLAELVGNATQGSIFDEEMGVCESGHCMT